MFKEIEMNQNDMFGFEVKGKLTAEDYQQTLEPLLSKARADGKKIRFLMYLGPDFTGFTPGASWEDFKVGMRYLRIFERCAVVTDIKWIRNATKFFGSMVPYPVNVYPNDSLNEAKLWLNSGEIGLDHRLDESSGVVKVEINAPLSSENFEILAHTVDSWIERGGKLNGVVIHAKKFPGWENLGSLLKHIEFVKNHHRKIPKVALCLDGAIPSLATHLAKHFVEAEVKHFDYDKLDEALAWARQH